MTIFWLLIIQIYNPCCDISVTRFETEAECAAAQQVIMSTRVWNSDIAKGMNVGCAIAKTEAAK